MIGKLRIQSLLLMALFVLVVLSPGSFTVCAGAPSQTVELQILSVNDFHGALSAGGKNPGAAQLARYIDELRSQKPDGTLLVSAGDMFQGSPDSNLLYGRTVVDIMNHLRFDAMTIGNHEFDWGEDVLRQRISQAQFPFVCANIIDKQTGKPVDFLPPFVLIERQGIKIAVIGIATPETAVKTNPKWIAGYRFADPAAVLRDIMPELIRQGADIVIALTHLPSWMDEQGMITGEGAAVAKEVPDLAAVITGHSHQAVYGLVNDVPVIQAGYNGRAVGVIELVYDVVSRKVTEASVRTDSIPTDGPLADPAVQAILTAAQTEIAPVKETEVGYLTAPLSHDRYAPVQTLLGQWVTDSMRQAAKADMAFQNTGGLRADLMQGRITIGQLYEVLPFDNTLFTVEMTGRQLLRVIEFGLDNKYGMVQFSGLRIVWDQQASPGNRLVGVTLADGRPLLPDKSYVVVTNDFMASGGDGFTMFKEGKKAHDTNIPVRDVLVDVFRRQGAIHFTGDDRLLNRPITRQQQEAA